MPFKFRTLLGSFLIASTIAHVVYPPIGKALYNAIYPPEVTATVITRSDILSLDYE